MELSRSGLHSRLTALPQSELTKCKVDGCFTAVWYFGHEYCNRHYRRLKKYGDVSVTAKYVGDGYTAEEKFWSKVDRTGGPDSCWNWLGSLMNNGYGCSRYKGKTVNSHRLAWRLSQGYFPESGKMLLHSCHNRLCCNPTHMREGTHTENMQDMVKSRRSCQGQHHPDAVLTEESVRYIRSNPDGLTQIELGRIFSTSQATISKVQRRDTWKHVI